jgi:hypothetical protein
MPEIHTWHFENIKKSIHHAAELLGKISALQDQNSALLSRLVPEIEGNKH